MNMMTAEVSLEGPADERREVFSDLESSNEESQPTEPATKKKFVPSKELLESLNSYIVRPSKNEDCKKVLGKFPKLACDAGHPLKLNDAMEQLLPQWSIPSGTRLSESTWLSSELPKVSPDTLTRGGIPGIRRRLNSEGATTTKDKDEPGRSLPGSDMHDNLSKAPNPTHRQDVSSHPGSLSGPFALQKLAGPQTQGIR